MSVSHICHQGVIKEIKDQTLYVEVERLAACASCHAKTVCLSFSKKDEIIPVTTNEPEAFEVGERVQIQLKKSLGAKAVVIAYLFPFLVLALGLFVTYYFTRNELFSIGISFVATALYFIFIKKLDNKLKKQFSFFASKVEI